MIDADIHWVDPSPEVMHKLDNKVAALTAAVATGVPVMLKASWGGRRLSMQAICAEAELDGTLSAARRWRNLATTRCISSSWCIAKACAPVEKGRRAHPGDQGHGGICRPRAVAALVKTLKE